MKCSNGWDPRHTDSYKYDDTAPEKEFVNQRLLKWYYFQNYPPSYKKKFPLTGLIFPESDPQIHGEYGRSGVEYGS